MFLKGVLLLQQLCAESQQVNLDRLKRWESSERVPRELKLVDNEHCLLYYEQLLLTILKILRNTEIGSSGKRLKTCWNLVLLTIIPKKRQ